MASRTTELLNQLNQIDTLLVKSVTSKETVTDLLKTRRLLREELEQLFTEASC
jgi:hypothetical protein